MLDGPKPKRPLNTQLTLVRVGTGTFITSDYLSCHKHMIEIYTN